MKERYSQKELIEILKDDFCIEHETPFSKHCVLTNKATEVFSWAIKKEIGIKPIKERIDIGGEQFYLKCGKCKKVISLLPNTDKPEYCGRCGWRVDYEEEKK